MRLTLRTLLAHLDRTLDPDDDAVIAAKLRESDFASRLVERVRACLHSDTLESPAPLATGTADDANRIGEYLDSVLSSEQVAEVERMCLESDAHLAEVAACHQILTLVLAKPAEIPAALRNQLYELVQEPGTDLNTTNGNGVPAAASAASPTRVNPAGAAAPRAVAAPPAIAPVGPDDSGVSDAPTRLKQEVTATAAAAQAKPALAGSKRLSRSDLADFSGRPSRVVPWLVSLALVAAFLFVASQAFAPLLQRRAADDDRALTLSDSYTPATVEDDAADTAADDPNLADPPRVPAAPRGTAATDRDSGTGAAAPTSPPASAGSSTAQPPTGQPPAEESAITPPVVSPPAVGERAEARPGAVPPLPQPPPVGAATPPSSDPSNGSLPVVEEVEVADGSTAPAAPPGDIPAATPAAPATDPPPTLSEVAPPVAAEVPLPSSPIDARAGVDPIMITSEESLLLIREPDSETWMLGKQGDIVQPGSELICPPLYRDRMSIHGEAEITLIGPARAVLRPSAEMAAELVLDYGRFLVAGVGEEQRQISILFEETNSTLTLPAAGHIAAIEVRALRPPGMNPEDASATQRFVQVWAAEGMPQWRSGNRPEVTLETGQLLTLGSGNLVSLTDARSTPAWVAEPVEAVGSIESSARKGLLELVRSNEAIELSLREAMDFRRAEVGAIAAQTLLLLGRHDVYFGGEGVFNQVRQRTYWPEHFNAMLDAINRGPETAAAVRAAITQMDAAQANEIYRLLWLRSDSQLAAGGDAALVQALDSSNMTIRVLAAENLRHITGTTLLYKPEVEMPSRRASDIKKWETRLRRGEIRWATSTDDDAEAADEAAGPEPL